MDKLKPCPFCGDTKDLDAGVVEQPDAFWDSSMRGEEYGYVICYRCGCILKANRLNEAIDTWNRRTSDERI